MAELVEIRVLGGFEVRDERGELVDPAAWRTSKTRDLVRLLAMAAGRVVPAEGLVEALWPDVDPERGRASLRTAASQARHVLGAEHLVRRTGGLVLTCVWVDALAFEALASTAGQQLSTGQLADGVMTAWDAVTLYTGDLYQDEPYAAATGSEREHYRRVLKRLLLDAADAACRLGWLRDAAELGHRALRLDPCAEAAYRVLMRTYAHLGETEHALGLYETCRAVLADAFGADPAPETRALHVQLLRPEPPVEVAPPFVGRAPFLDQMRAAMTSVLEEGRPAGFLITGQHGSGRRRFVREVVREWPHQVVQVRAPELVGRCPLDRSEPLLLVVEDLSPDDQAQVDAVRGLLEQGAPCLVLVTAPPGDAAAPHALLADERWRAMPLPALSDEEVTQLLRPVLGTAPARSLVAELVEQHAGAPGAVLQAARRLLRTGQLRSTSDGLVRASWNPSRAPADLGARLLSARRQTAPYGERVLELLAVLDRSTPVGELSGLTSLPPTELEQALGQLCDLGVVTTTPGGYRLRGVVERELVYRWLRPSVRRALHRQVAEAAVMPSSERIDHWLAGGEPALACAAGLLAADEALLAGDDEGSRSCLVRVLAFARHHADGAADVVALHERLAIVEERLGRLSAARASLESALELARPGPPAVLARLHRALARLSTSPREALRWYARAADLPGLDCGDRSRIALAVAVTNAGRSPTAAVRLLRRAVEDADRTDDVRAQVEARLLLAAAAALQRLLAESYEVSRSAVALAELTGDPLLVVRAVHALARTPALLGGGLRERGLLLRLHEQARALGDAATLLDVSLSLGLVLHELDDPELAHLWPSLTQLARSTRRSCSRLLLDAVVSVERDQVGRAERLLGQATGSCDHPLHAQAGHLVLARLRARTGDAAAALDALDALEAQSRATGVVLLVPEATAFRALLLADRDPDAATRSLELAVRVAGDRTYPREQVCILRARAGVLAASGRAQAGATMALASVLSARRSSLVHEEAESQRLRAALLRLVPGPSPHAQPVHLQRA